MSLNTRIAKFRESKGLNRVQFAEKLGVAPSSIDSAEKGPSTPGSRLLMKIKETFPDLDLNWLITGEKEHDFSRDETLPMGPFCIPVKDIYCSAGAGAHNMDHAPVLYNLNLQEEFIRQVLHANPRTLEAIFVSGDSMYPTISSGDLILLDRNRREPGHGIYVVRYCDELFIKRVQPLPGMKAELISDNKIYRPLIVDMNEDFQIIGKAIWHFRRI